jgi:hypothetical protein
MATIESDGYDVNGFMAERTFRASLRSARDTTGQRLLDINGNVDNVEGVRVVYAMPGLWPVGTGTTPGGRRLQPGHPGHSLGHQFPDVP